MVVTAAKLRNEQGFLVFFDLRLPALGRRDVFQCIDYERGGD